MSNRHELSRRSLLATLGLGALAAPLAARADGGPTTTRERMLVTINSSTIRPTPVERKIEAAARAGYDGIELWIDEIDGYERDGGSLEDLGKRIRDAGLIVPNVIGLWDAMPADEAAWPACLELQKGRMERSRRVGAQRIAVIATPDRPEIDVLWAAERYRRYLDAGDEIGIRAAIEFVGFFRGIHTLGQAVAIAMESGHPEPCIVADTFHLYRGGSMYDSIRWLRGDLLGVCHVNDAPASPPQFEQGDSDRVYPGDGILPLEAFLQRLWTLGFRGPLSLELFREEHWKMDPLEVARTGLRKIHEVLDRAGVPYRS